MMKGLIQQENINLANIYAPNIGAPKYIKQILTDFKGDIDSSSVIVGDYKTSLTPMNRYSRHKVNKKTVALKNTLEQMDLIDIFGAFHPKAAEYTFF